MSPRKKRQKHLGTPKAESDGPGRKQPYDLIDFYGRWAEFREIALALARRADLSASQRETINWLILLVDRINTSDIGPLERR